jgi:transposase
VAKTERFSEATRARLRALAKDRYWGEAEARAALEAFTASGLTRAAFQRETQISIQRLKWWTRRIAGDEAEPAEKIEFVPVELAAAAPAGDATMEVLVGQYRVRVGPAFDAVALRRLLAALSEVSC